MFREDYIKDNELIKPDDDFLTRLKESVKQEEEIVHIGDYVDYTNADSFEKIGRDDTNVVEMKTGRKISLGWKTFSMIAACFVLVGVIAFAVGNDSLLGGEGLRAEMESGLSEEIFTSNETASDLDEEYIALYDEVYDLFATSNVVIYEMDSYIDSGDGIECLAESTDQYRELEIQDRDELVGNILAEQYVLTDTTEEWDSVMYYLVEFENQTYVVLAVGSDQFICIEGMSEIQKMAWK